MKIISRLFLLVFACVGLFLQSCKQDDVLLENNQAKEPSPSQKFLTFDSYDNFDKVLLNLRQNSKGLEDLIAYANGQSFYSMANFYQKVEQEQEKHDAWAESLSDEEYTKLEASNPDKLYYPAFVLENRSLLRFDQYHNPLMNVYDPALAALISPQGIVKIGEVLYYFNNKGSKAYVGGDESNIQELIQAQQETDNIKLNQNAVKEVPLTSEKLELDY